MLTCSLQQGEQKMQNNYIKQLAIKSYQEDLEKEYLQIEDESFHAPSFVLGVMASLFFIHLV